jgi:hypothetical protein
MTNFTGLTRDTCAAGCTVNGCAITGLSRCCHPLKGGPPIERLNDLATMEAFDRACTALGVPNRYVPGEQTQ